MLVEGRMNQDPATGGPRVWTGQDGSPRASFEMTAQTVRFLSSRGEDQSSGGGSNYGEQNGAMIPPTDDADLPF